jgi:hypothetical protein
VAPKKWVRGATTDDALRIIVVGKNHSLQLAGIGLKVWKNLVPLRGQRWSGGNA